MNPTRQEMEDFRQDMLQQNFLDQEHEYLMRRNFNYFQDHASWQVALEALQKLRQDCLHYDWSWPTIRELLLQEGDTC